MLVLLLIPYQTVHLSHICVILDAQAVLQISPCSAYNVAKDIICSSIPRLQLLNASLARPIVPLVPVQPAVPSAKAMPTTMQQIITVQLAISAATA